MSCMAQPILLCLLKSRVIAPALRSAVESAHAALLIRIFVGPGELTSVARTDVRWITGCSWPALDDPKRRSPSSTKKPLTTAEISFLHIHEPADCRLTSI